MSELWKGGILAILVALQELLRPVLAGWFPGAPAAPPILGLLTVVILYVAYDRFDYKLRGIDFIRRRLIHLAQFEGFWISNVSDTDAPFSISKVYYSRTSNCWVYHGFAYSPHGLKIREWRVLSIYFDCRTREWFFDGSWWDHFQNERSAETQRGEPHDQVSLWILSRMKRNLQTTLYFDNPRSAGSPTKPFDMPRSGRGEMCYIPLRRLSAITGIKIRYIEDISPEMAKRIMGSQQTLFQEFIET